MSDPNWQYTDATNAVVTRTLANGICESKLASSLDVQALIAKGNLPLAAGPMPEVIPDLATQIAAALLAKGTLADADFHPDTLATIKADS